MAVRTRIISVIRRVGFHFESSTGSSNLTLQRVVNRIAPLSIVTPLSLQIWWGLREGPVDNLSMSLYLKAVDVNNIPDVAALRLSSEWQATIGYEAAGTPANLLQMIEHENLFFVGGPTSNVELAHRTREFGWAFMTEGFNGSIILQGVFTYRIDYIQREHGSDNYTFESDEWSDDALHSNIYGDEE